MLKINFRTLIQHRFSVSRKLLLVSDSVFPAKDGTHLPLQRDFNYIGPKNPIKFLTFVLLTTFETSTEHVRNHAD